MKIARADGVHAWRPGEIGADDEERRHLALHPDASAL